MVGKTESGTGLIRDAGQKQTKLHKEEKLKRDETNQQTQHG